MAFRLRRACLRRWSATDTSGFSSIARILDDAIEDIVRGQIGAKCIQTLSSGLGHFFRHVEFEKDDDTNFHIDFMAEDEPVETETP